MAAESVPVNLGTVLTDESAEPHQTVRRLIFLAVNAILVEGVGEHVFQKLLEFRRLRNLRRFEHLIQK